MTDLHPPGPELAFRNRRILADRLNWPPGALDACEQLDRPGWSISYQRTFHDRPAGFYAAHRCLWSYGDVEAYGTTPDDLDAAIAEHHCPQPPQWSRI